MTDTPEHDGPEASPGPASPPNPDKPAGADRIAKVIARAGLASRRDAERMIIEGRVSVNGAKIASPALDVLPSDKVTVDGKPLEAPQDTRLWLYYKPVGLVTSESDEKGRQTVFDALPRDLPRVMSVGRLDLNSEGLLLLTNDGELKRRLELPSTGWLRRYRVRVNGQPNDLIFKPLRDGAVIDGEEFQPMEIKIDSQKGANAWLTVGIREGRNREIRRAMAHVGLMVNRLIRTGYGPFRLTGMEENEVKEIRRRVLKDQLGGLLTGEETAPGAEGERAGDRRGGGRPRDGERKSFGRRGETRRSDDGKPFARRDEGGERKPYGRRDGDRSRGEGPRKPYGQRGDAGDRKPYGARGEGGDRKPY
ncbi:MAG: pseudouridine synthase, partial [Paracoccus sp. (in: a-proteobacteria)]|nr:pseudouridine synthase [Paracoccus sp. (in: a-proteobacteria)]